MRWGLHGSLRRYWDCHLGRKHSLPHRVKTPCGNFLIFRKSFLLVPPQNLRVFSSMRSSEKFSAMMVSYLPLHTGEVPANG